MMNNGDDSGTFKREIIQHLLPWPGEVRPGQVFTWGRGSHGQLGHRTCYPKENCAIPYPVPTMNNVVWVSCGGGQQGCTACVTSLGEVYTWGNNSGQRLGHNDLKTPNEHVRKPKLVKYLDHDPITQVSCGLFSMLALSRLGTVYSWGSNKNGALGIGVQDTKHVEHKPVLIQNLNNILWIDCESDYCGCLCNTGRVYMWGSNLWGGGVGGRTKGPKWSGKLGLGDGVGKYKITPQTLSSLSNYFIQRLNLGSVYAGCCSEEGALYMWGYGGHGNLGLGNRKSCSLPQRVEYLKDVQIIDVACTVGQEGPKGDFYPKKQGGEGPHTICLSITGEIYTFGTGHKGVLANLAAKSSAFNEPFDELLPYKVGYDKIRNSKSKRPLSVFAAWPPPYAKAMGAAVCSIVSAHIHCGLITSKGEAWAWGCGSNDGRCGVERFLNMSGDGRPPKVDEMKCYMMQPHRVGFARKEYWKYGNGLQNVNILQLASGRNHMAAIGLVKEDLFENTKKFIEQKKKADEAISNLSSSSDDSSVDDNCDNNFIGTTTNLEYRESLISMKKGNQ
jgi:alpha-tubulin suppressor-like RCC1 family protein